MEKVLLTVQEFADLVGVGRSAAYMLVRNGRVRAVRMTPRGAVRVPIQAVEDFINSLPSAVTTSAA